MVGVDSNFLRCSGEGLQCAGQIKHDIVYSFGELYFNSGFEKLRCFQILASGLSKGFGNQVT